MDKETLRMQMLSGIITESEYKAKLEEFKKDSLNEHYVAGGIVGIGAINQIPSRVKADYEDAFEYFLSQKYSLNEIEEVEEALDSKIANDPNFKKLASYFKQNPDEAKDVKDELSSLKEAYKDKGKYYVEDAYGNKKEVPFKEYLKDKLLAIGLPAAALGLVGALMAGPLGAMDPGSILQAIGIAAGIGGAAGAALDYGKPTSIKETEVEELDLYEANPLEGGPGYMTKYRVGVLSALIADAEKDLIKYEESSFFTPELIEKMKGTIERLKSSREALKAQYREETGKDV